MADDFRARSRFCCTGQLYIILINYYLIIFIIVTESKDCSSFMIKLCKVFKLIFHIVIFFYYTTYIAQISTIGFQMRITIIELEKKTLKLIGHQHPKKKKRIENY